MIGQRHEVDHSITKPSKCQTREQMRADIEAQVAAFQKKGREIESVGRGVSGFVPKPVRRVTKEQQASKCRELAKGKKGKYESRVWNDGGAAVK